MSNYSVCAVGEEVALAAVHAHEDVDPSTLGPMNDAGNEHLSDAGQNSDSNADEVI
jgi:hypothetical protein